MIKILALMALKKHLNDSSNKKNPPKRANQIMLRLLRVQEVWETPDLNYQHARSGLNCAYRVTY